MSGVLDRTRSTSIDRGSIDEVLCVAVTSSADHSTVRIRAEAISGLLARDRSEGFGRPDPLQRGQPAPAR